MDVQELGSRYREAWLVARRVPSGIHLGYSAYWARVQPEPLGGLSRRGSQTQAAGTLLPSLWTGWSSAWAGCGWLSEDERDLVWLRASGLPWREIAKSTGVPRTTVSRHWHRALMQVILRINL